MMYWPYGNYFGWSSGSMIGWVGGGIMMVVFWGLIIYLIVWAVKKMSGTDSHSNSNALDVLKDRYAKGEIDKKEFEEKSRDIKSF